MAATTAMNTNLHSIDQIYFACDKPARYRFLKHLHPDNIANLFRVLNTAEGGGADSLPAAFKLAFRYWCMNEELPLHFNSYKPLECLRLQKFALDFNRSQVEAVVRDVDIRNPWR